MLLDVVSTARLKNIPRASVPIKPGAATITVLVVDRELDLFVTN